MGFSKPESASPKRKSSASPKRKPHASPKRKHTPSPKRKPFASTLQKKLVISNLKRKLAANRRKRTPTFSPKASAVSSQEKREFVSNESKEKFTSTIDADEKKSKRGINTMHRIVRRKLLGVRKNVEYNEKGQPHGKAAKEMQSYIGVLARTKIPITIPSWKKVDMEMKNKLWESVEV